ncbi:MAG TPA: ImmA/IrrE family metallo-endopeptidase [Candidatus Saccharimonadales bacterium]|nr:ImmA/IrrE family metallo-endopeptidase [Candidatus Saccharimonadales bacterium]
MQASRLRQWADATEPDMNLIWLVEQTAVPVHFVASYKLDEQSGLTTNGVEGRLRMFINQSEPAVRQRFTLLHEFKHVLDFDDDEVLHAKLGRGNQKLKKDMIEWIANEFSACGLMPIARVKREWCAWRDLPTVANIFNVSVEAMANRLERLGLIETNKPKPRVYFRRPGLTLATDTSDLLMAA